MIQQGVSRLSSACVAACHHHAVMQHTTVAAARSEVLGSMPQPWAIDLAVGRCILQSTAKNDLSLCHVIACNTGQAVHHRHMAANNT